MRKIDILICAGLMAAVWAVFGQTLTHDFVNYDDRVYVTQNPQVNAGLTTSGIVWSFTHAHANNWHPLTTMSHMIDCQLFGLRAGPHHAVNVALHACAALLLYLFLRLTTAAVWPSAFVAAVFALHPLRVESVAWIAERKDVLSAVFLMVALIAYVRYTRASSLGWYTTMSILSACALLSKPMMVTLPFLLLLIDIWPPKRSTSSKLIVEKLPLFVMAAAVGVVTYFLQRNVPGSVVPLPLLWRIRNALVSCVVYIGQLLWPNDLIIFYPPRDHSPLWQVIAAGAGLLGITTTIFYFRRAKPYLVAGWLWYIVALFPVVGVIGFGLQAHADRYTYVPQIGLVIAITWLIVDLTGTLANRRVFLALGAIIAVLSLGACSWRQTAFWRNSETLWSHALAVEPNNAVAHTNLGLVLMEKGRADEAFTHFQTALELYPPTPHYALSRALTLTNLAIVLAQRGDVDLAREQLRSAIQLEPRFPDAHYDLALLFSSAGDLDGAVGELEKTLSLRPNDVEARITLAGVFLQQDREREAIQHYEMALKVAPHHAIAANNLAWTLVMIRDQSLRDPPRAVALAKTAVTAQPNNVIFLRTLAAASAADRQFENARTTATKALQIANANNDVDLARKLEADLDLYARDESLSIR